MESFTDAFMSLFETNMGLKAGERILIFSDIVRSDETPSEADLDRRRRLLQVAREAADFAQGRYGNTLFANYDATAASGAEPPESLWRSAMGDEIVDVLIREGMLSDLIRKEATATQLDRAREIVIAGKSAVADIAIALANNSTSHTRFRSLMNYAGCRFASLPTFDPQMFFTAMNVDWLALAERTAALAARVNAASELALTTPNGTSIRFSKRGRTAAGDDGLLTKPGSFGNLPAGEVYLAPLEGTSQGVLVLEYAPTRKLSAQLRLKIKDGAVTSIEGDEPHRLKLEQKFAESEKNRNVAELGIGTNSRARRADNILEAEKILGTVHVALGDNSGFGGTVQTSFHEDYVFYQPTLTAIKEDGSEDLLLDQGNPLF